MGNLAKHIGQDLGAQHLITDIYDIGRMTIGLNRSRSRAQIAGVPKNTGKTKLIGSKVEGLVRPLRILSCRLG